MLMRSVSSLESYVVACHLIPDNHCIPLKLWSEASSLRHCPEALWFLFHTMAMSPTAESLWTSASALETVPGGRDRRLIMRNLMQVGEDGCDEGIVSYCTS